MFLLDWWRKIRFTLILLLVWGLFVAWAAGRYLPRVPLVYRIICGVRVVKYTPPKIGVLTIKVPEKKTPATHRRSNRD